MYLINHHHSIPPSRLFPPHEICSSQHTDVVTNDKNISSFHYKFATHIHHKFKYPLHNSIVNPVNSTRNPPPTTLHFTKKLFAQGKRNATQRDTETQIPLLLVRHQLGLSGNNKINTCYQPMWTRHRIGPRHKLHREGYIRG